MISSSVIELDRSALRDNLRFIKAQMDPETHFCSVIKGNAYGHGILSFVPMAESLGVKSFAVFDAMEALVAYQARTREDTRIIIMGALPDDALAWAIEHDISFFVFDAERLSKACSLAKSIQHPARIHLELETGLNRTGFAESELGQVLDTARQAGDLLQLEGICTHLAGAESIANYYRIQQQIEQFRKLTQSLKDREFEPRRCHAACSAAIIRYPETQYDMVRCGIMQFGFWPSPETRMAYVLGQQKRQSNNMRFVDPLRRVMCWKSTVMSIKHVSAGSYVGYGNAFLSTKDMKLAGIPVGYFHGYSRRLSNAGYVLIRGMRAGVVGIINMHMLMVDVTHLPDLKRGEEVVIIGKQKKNKISVQSFSEMTQLLNYEVLVSIPSEIPRVVIN